MAHEREKGASRGRVIYGQLLRLYPRAYLRRHRDELLQNFQDLERELPAKTSLWCLIVKDLLISLWSERCRTLGGQTAIRFAILSLMLLMVHRYPGPREHSAWTFCVGYAPGWFAGWFGWQWRMSSSRRSRGAFRSFRGQAVMLLVAITLVLAAGMLFPDLQQRLVFASCYGVAIAWLGGWWGNARRLRL